MGLPRYGTPPVLSNFSRTIIRLIKANQSGDRRHHPPQRSAWAGGGDRRHPRKPSHTSHPLNGAPPLPQPQGDPWSVQRRRQYTEWDALRQTPPNEDEEGMVWGNPRSYRFLMRQRANVNPKPPVCLRWLGR